MVEADLLFVELRGSPVSQDDVLRLAQKLDLHNHNTDATFELENDEWKLRHTVEKSLAALHDDDPDRHNRLINIRVFYETIMIWAIARLKRLEAIAALDDIQARLQDIWQHPDQHPDAFQKCWEFDGELHKAICEWSNHASLSLVVDIVQENLSTIGIARSQQDVRETWEEHEQILQGLRLDSTTMIEEAVDAHIRRACERWSWQTAVDRITNRAVADVRSRLRAKSGGLERAIRAAIEHLDATHDRLPLLKCDLAVEDLLLQQQYADQFVVYRDTISKDGNVPRLQKREIHLSADEWDEVEAFLETLPHEDRKEVKVEFQDDPELGSI